MAKIALEAHGTRTVLDDVDARRMAERLSCGFVGAKEASFEELDAEKKNKGPLRSNSPIHLSPGKTVSNINNINPEVYMEVTFLFIVSQRMC